MPNPFYQIYEGAALLAGAEPYYLDTLPESRFLPDLQAVPAAVWERCQLLFLCSPGNPTGAVMSQEYLYDRARDRGSLWFHHRCGRVLRGLSTSMRPPAPEPVAGGAGSPAVALRALRGISQPVQALRASPGLRSGFVVGDPQIMQQYHLYRTYHGAAVGTHVPRWRAHAAWRDDAHAAANRALYREKFAEVVPILEPVVRRQAAPDAAPHSHLWADTGEDG